jgi:hypothetical protein
MAKGQSASQKRRKKARKANALVLMATVKAPGEGMTGKEMIAKQKEDKLAKKVKLLTPAKKKTKVYKVEDKFLVYALVLSGLNVYKCNLGFLILSRALFFEFINNVFSMLTRNIAVYPTPSPTIVAIQAEMTLYYAAKAAKDTATANQHLANIKYMMKQLAIYVANTCGNDLPTLEKSGFIANKLGPGPQKEIGQAVIREIKASLHTGKFSAVVDKVDGANYYRGYWRPADDPEAPLTATRGGAGVKVLFEGVPANIPVLLYVIASGPLEDGDISPEYPYTSR